MIIYKADLTLNWDKDFVKSELQISIILTKDLYNDTRITTYSMHKDVFLLKNLMCWNVFDEENLVSYLYIGSELLVFILVTINKSSSRISTFLSTKFGLEGSPILSLPYFTYFFLLAQQSGDTSHSWELEYTSYLSIWKKHVWSPKPCNSICLCKPLSSFVPFPALWLNWRLAKSMHVLVKRCIIIF